MWVNLEWGGSALTIDPAIHAADVAAALDLDPSEVEAVDQTSDPRSGDLVALPPKSPPAASPAEIAVAALAAASDIDGIKGALATYLGSRI